MIPKVSIIVPCYNGEEYIRTCVESIKAQTFENWEAIFVVDVPSQEMLDILSRYSERDSRIRSYSWWEKTNPAHARNMALNYAVGLYVAFLDGDDWWSCRKLSVMVETLDAFPKIRWCAHWVVEYWKTHYHEPKVYPGHDMSIGGTGAIMCWRELLDRVKRERGFVFDESMNRNDDADLVLYIRKEPSKLIPENLSYMRIRNDGLESSVSRYEDYKIRMMLGWRHQAYGLMIFHTALFLLRGVGIDPVEIKRKVLHYGSLQKVSDD